jgi:ATF/CREB family transcription factor
MDSKKSAVKSEDASADAKDQKPSADAESLPPPPRPAASGSGETPDYFNSLHNPFSLEPNPFEQSFGNPATETPGKSLLPPVASIASPALPGVSSANYNWPNSLRSGPLSPAMLAGPTGSDYFDNIGRGFPTPNESSLRTGLTPGGGGSMFPAPSPNTQSLLNQLQGGGATPSTLEFHRTALNAAKRSAFNVPTSNPTTEPEQLAATTMDTKTSQPAAADPFTHHDAADAANGLFMLAKGGQANMPNQNAPNLSSEPVADTKRTRNANNSISSGREMTAEGSDTQGEQSKPAARGKGKKNQPGKGAASVNGRRKAEEPAKGPNKRAKINGSIEMTPEDDSDMDDSKDDYGGKDPKKMTDEEKRKNFLERNRVAALKCRQRKKQWLANLQAKVEMFTTENDALTATVTQLREEIVNLKTLLLAHKDCPVSQAQGLGPLIMNGMSAGFDPHPYSIANNMAMQPGPMPAQAIRR